MVPGQLAPAHTLPAQPETRTLAGQQTDRQLLEAFTERHDEGAFEALVQRHGPMVLGVCQRVLDNAYDAEDAFQATFLVLVRKARAVQKPELLGNWLYGVAFRTARKARAQAARRSHHERRAASMPKANPLPDLVWQDLRAVLDQELQQLPQKYRAPLVLCYLEGLTNEEAAQRLGWPAGSMSYRLARGRELLGARLKKRKQAMPAGMFALALTRAGAATNVPAPLVESTVRAAMAWARGKEVGAGAISVSVSALAKATLQAMAAARRQFLALLFLLLLFGLGIGLIAYGMVTDAPYENGSGSGCHSGT